MSIHSCPRRRSRWELSEGGATSKGGVGGRELLVSAPYLLRRRKVGVNTQLPKKKEQVRVTWALCLFLLNLSLPSLSEKQLHAFN